MVALRALYAEGVSHQSPGSRSAPWVWVKSETKPQRGFTMVTGCISDRFDHSDVNPKRIVRRSPIRISCIGAETLPDMFRDDDVPLAIVA